MEPAYLNENRYSFLIGSWQRPASAAYKVETPESLFERHVQERFMEGQQHLHHEEYTLALDAFQEVLALILKTVHPKMPLGPFRDYLKLPKDAGIIDILSGKAADMLNKTAPLRYQLPDNLISTTSLLPASAQQSLDSLTASGLQITSFHKEVSDNVTSALEAAGRNEWKIAVQLFHDALAKVPESEKAIRGGIQHDLAVLHEKLDQKAKARELALASIETFSGIRQNDAHAQALATAAGIFGRVGEKEKATEFAQQLDKIRETKNLNDVVKSADINVIDPTRFSLAGSVRPTNFSRLNERSVLSTMSSLVKSKTFSYDQAAPELIGLKFVNDAVTSKTMILAGTTDKVNITLGDQGQTNVKSFLETLTATKDLGLLTAWRRPAQFVAYLPHMYFYVVPMAIGDCYVGLGDLVQARDTYTEVLKYPHINKNYEIVKLWIRLAQTLLDLGDQAYRNARDNVASYAASREFYEQIVKPDRTLTNNSLLYADAKFGTIKNRVIAFLNADDPSSVMENPAIMVIVLNALGKLQQIAEGLNFFGFGPHYIPPFSFEYLQNTARYMAQQASHTEQRYIQYKSQAENEEFRREQMDQQAQVAAQTVVLEQRGVAEAQRGIEVANASLNYANVQEQNAVASRNDFNNVRWELLELAEAEAWAGAAAMDEDDEVKQTWNGNYYNARKKNRSDVIQDLAYRRTRISHDLEAAKLNRAIASAQAYKGVAQAQRNQAAARKAVAEQRVQIAKLQQRHAEENRDFLDMREFGAQLWYELAQQAKRIRQRYLDMAIEVAFLMERAYNAETARDLHVIRYDYEHTASGNLMGADQLLLDIDSFTYDLVTTTKTKKIPVKKTISLADSYAMAFQALKTTGRCLFETSLEDFDREHPGFYLAKIRNVELSFVGITGATSIAGTLRNVGVSRFRSPEGTIISRLYPADVMALSQYDIRQDALAFRFNPNDLRLFENNGIETLWQLELPMSANDFDFNEILDVQLVLYYDGFFDATLETAIAGALPTTGEASRAFSLRLSFPDELFYLKNQGEAEVSFDKNMFPKNQKDLIHGSNMLKVTGAAATINGLTIRLRSAVTGTELVVTTDADGIVENSKLSDFHGKALFDTWTLRVTAADNPAMAPGGVLDLAGLKDVLIFSEYSFTYR